MLNRWLLYQVLACRVWGRSAFYQSGGAFGFRDQLQDVMALVYSAPEEARAQILRSAAGSSRKAMSSTGGIRRPGSGVRTRITDDLFFLPLVVHHYVTMTGDAAVARRAGAVPQVAGAPPGPGGRLRPAGGERESGTRVRALRPRAGARLQARAAGLPLMGTGDWNDGMNQVGVKGKGESVWNGWFFVTVLNAFAELAERAGTRRSSELVPGAGGGAAGRTRGTRLGRRLVPPGVLRRRHAARLGPERRMPNRRDPSVVGGDLRRGGPGAGASGDGGGRRATGATSTTG